MSFASGMQLIGCHCNGTGKVKVFVPLTFEEKPKDMEPRFVYLKCPHLEDEDDQRAEGLEASNHI